MHNFFVLEVGDKWARDGTKFRPLDASGHPNAVKGPGPDAVPWTPLRPKEAAKGSSRKRPRTAAAPGSGGGGGAAEHRARARGPVPLYPHPSSLIPQPSTLNPPAHRAAGQAGDLPLAAALPASCDHAPCRDRLTDQDVRGASLGCFRRIHLHGVGPR